MFTIAVSMSQRCGMVLLPTNPFFVISQESVPKNKFGEMINT